VRLQSSERGCRSFCGTCGTPLVFEHQDFPEELDVTLCSLDEPEAIAPRDHTYLRSRLPWVDRLGGLDRYPLAREER
jgi:hypothetical protein